MYLVLSVGATTMAIASGTITCETKEDERAEKILEAQVHSLISPSRWITAGSTGMVVDQTILLRRNPLLHVLSFSRGMPFAAHKEDFLLSQAHLPASRTTKTQRQEERREDYWQCT